MMGRLVSQSCECSLDSINQSLCKSPLYHMPLTSIDHTCIVEGNFNRVLAVR
jgi:hypothetical protein